MIVKVYSNTTHSPIGWAHIDKPIKMGQFNFAKTHKGNWLKQSIIEDWGWAVVPLSQVVIAIQCDTTMLMPSEMVSLAQSLEL